MAELKEIDTLITQIGAASNREITPEVYEDILFSLKSVGGTLFVSGGSMPVTTNWAAVTAWSNSIDTKGLNEDLVAGNFVVGTGAGGVYAVDVSMSILAPGNGWIEIAVTKNGGLTPYRAKRQMVINNDGSFGIVGSGNLVSGDTIGLAVRASGNATVDVTYGQYRAIRI